MRSISRTAFLSILVLSSLGALAAQTVAPSGAFGFLLSTSYTDPTNQGGAAILGLMNFDGAGNVRGSYTLEYGSGGILPVETIPGTFTGTYSSNPDGTGTITINLTHGISLTLAMVVDTTGRGLELVVTSCSGASIDLSNTVLSGFGAKRSVVAPKGSYGLKEALSPQPSSSIGVMSLDGAGNVTAFSSTFVGAGPNVSTGTYLGFYSVNANGTGTISLSATSTQSVQKFVYVIVSGGSELLLLQINRSGNGVLFGTAKLQ